MIFYNILFVIYIAITFISFIMVSFISCMEAEHETNILKFAFYFQINLWQYWQDKLNLAGLIILIGFTSIAILPTNIILLIVKCLIWLCARIWDGFLYIFRKRSKENKE